MPIQSAALGRRAETIADVDTRWVLAYAAGLGFDRTLCLDDARPGGPAVPPSFCVGLEWILSGDPGRGSMLGITPEERIRGVHAFQDSVFHRPFRPGTRVRVTSEIRYMRRTRAGTLVANLLTSHDADSGELLAESWSGSIMRDVGCDAEEVGTLPPYLAAPPPPPPEDAARVTVATDFGLPHTYTECARIWNPIHSERAVALAAGLPGIILHGTATWGIAGREVLLAHVGGDVRRLKRLAGRFRAPVMAGGSLTVSHAAMPDGTIAFEVETDGAQVAMNGGLIELDRGAPAA
jgi:acyl dehydratase